MRAEGERVWNNVGRYDGVLNVGGCRVSCRSTWCVHFCARVCGVIQLNALEVLRHAGRMQDYLSFQVHVVFQQQLEDVHVAVLTRRLHGCVSCALPVHLRDIRQSWGTPTHVYASERAILMSVYVCEYVCVRARARVCVCVRVCLYPHVRSGVWSAVLR